MSITHNSGISKRTHADVSALNAGQLEAYEDIVDFIENGPPDTSFAILQGQAGSGKTFLTRKVVAYLDRNDIPFKTAASTHKAAEVMSSVLSEDFSTKAMTVHKVFNIKLREDYDNDTGERISVLSEMPDILEGTVILIDESSMIASSWLDIIRKVTEALKLKILFIGDRCQLPPIVSNAVIKRHKNFKHMPPVFEQGFPTFNLTEIERQSNENPIISHSLEYRNALKGRKMPNITTQLATRGKGGIIKIDHFGEFEERVLSAFYPPVNGVMSDQDALVISHKNDVVNSWNSKIHRHLSGVSFSVDDNGRECPFIQGYAFVANNGVMLSPNERYPNTYTITPLNSGAYVVVEDVKTFVAFDIECYDITFRPFSEDGLLLSSITGRALVPLSVKDMKQKVEGVMMSAIRISGIGKSLYRDRCICRSDEKYLRKEHGFTGAIQGHQIENLRRRMWGLFYDMERTFLDLRPPYSCTAHKSQGSTMDAVYIDARDLTGIGRDWRLMARLFYVMFTRASHRVYVIGDIDEKIKNAPVIYRRSIE